MRKFLNKKNFIYGGIIILLVLAFVFADAYQRRKEVYDNLSIEFNDLKVEYGSNTKSTDLIKKTNGDINVVGEFNSKEVGDYELVYTVSNIEERYKQKVEKEYVETVKVVDSKAPIIEFVEDEIYVYVNSEYDLKENIARVYDEVDGDITDYSIDSNVDFTSRGEYEVKVTAKDKNGLSSTNSYNLIVRNRAVSGGEGYNIIYNYLTGTYGYNHAAACGILANIRFESNFNPDIGDYYYGLCQWGGGRRDNLYSYCASNGLDATTVEGQLAFMNYELSGSYSGVKDYLLSVANTSSGAWNAGDYFCRYYEGAASAAGRGDLAASYFAS